MLPVSLGRDVMVSRRSRGRRLSLHLDPAPYPADSELDRGGEEAEFKVR